MTTKPLFTNNAATALAKAITPTDTVLQITAGTGSYFPSPTGGNYFMLTLIQINNPEIAEIVQCTARVGDVLTIVRGQEGTQPQIFNISDNVELRITAGSLNLFATSRDTVTVFQEYQTASQNQTVFNIGSFTYLVGYNALSVYVNGSKQINGLNYTETSVSVITFLSGLNAGDVIEFIFVENIYG